MEEHILYAINWGSGVQPVDVATGALLKPVRFGSPPRGFEWDDSAALGRRPISVGYGNLGSPQIILAP